MLIPSCIALVALPLGAQVPQEKPRASIPRVTQEISPPELDGRLNEPFWDECLVITDLRQTVPVAGAAPSEDTEVLLAYDETNLYIGLRCWDKNPSGIRATQMARDANLDPDDRVEIVFDAFNNNIGAFWFQLGAAGSRGDALISSNGNAFNKRWDTIWYGESKITSEGWFGEIRIPFASINFDPENPEWGFNVRRHIRRHTEEVRWSKPDPRLRFFAPANAGTLEGFGGMNQGIGLDFIPFYVGAYTNLDTQGEHWEGDAGFDLFYRISPNTKLSLSYNTDFAETEVDARRVNLTRFPLFFPEKRKFFLEDSGIFNFGGGGGNGGNNPIPFFSRRIGIDGEGNEVPLLANAKLTSTGDGYSFGLLDSQTKTSGDLDARNLFAGRFAKNIFEQSSVGVIYTHGDPTGAQDDFTAGADLNLRTDSFMGDHSLRFTSYLLSTESDDTSGDNLAYATRIEYPNDEIVASAGYSTIESNFDPALGFVARAGIRQYDASFAYRPRLYNSVRRLEFQVSPLLITSTSGESQSKRLALTPFAVDWESDDEFQIQVVPQQETLTEEFDIHDSVSIPIGTHDFVRYVARFETSDRRAVSVELRYETGSFYDGNRNDYRVELDWRASKYAILGAQYDLNDVDLAEGSFDVNIASFKLDLLLSPRASWSNFVQWDDGSDNLGLNSRARYIFEPGQDLFIVLNQGWLTEDNGFAPTSSDLRFKVSYTFRF
ncbi:MAG: hypothetical protein ACI8X5_002873 [Planctomycetota bacterium]|jgi:hypothetical protein